MVACDEHKKRGKGSCSECGGCKCCPPPAGCSGVDHIQVGLGKGGGKRRRTRKEEAAQEGGMQQQKTRRSSRNSDVRGRHRKSMAEPESPDRPPPAAMQQPPPAARRTATASSAARSVAEAIISEMGKAAANGDAARSLESIVADAIEPHITSSAALQEAAAAAAINFLPRPSHQDRLSPRDKIQTMLDLVGETKPDAMAKMPLDGFCFGKVDSDDVTTSRTFNRAKGLFSTLAFRIAALVCPDHDADLVASLSIGPTPTRDSKLRCNTIRLALIGEREPATAAASLLSASYPHDVLREFFEESWPEVDVPTSRRTIGEDKFTSLRRTHDIIQDGMSVPKHSYNYRVSVVALRLAMEYMMDVLQLRPGATHSVKVDGHVFSNLPVYDRGGKNMEVLFADYKNAITEPDDRIGLKTYSTLLKMLTKRGEVKTSLSAYYFRFEYAKKVFMKMMDRLVEIMDEVAVIPLSNDRAKEFKDKFELLSQFLSYGYLKDHIEIESSVEEHCCRHAVNKRTDRGRCGNQANHSHEDGKVCSQCHDLFTFFLDGCDLAELIDEVASRAPQDDGETETASDIWSEVSAMKRTLPLFQKEVVDYASHHVRAKTQDAGIDEVYDNLKPDGSNGLLEFDHKQKFLPRWFREAQMLYFGKRGMSIGGFMLVRRVTRGGVVGLEFTYIDVIVENYSDQDHVQVSALMRIILEEVKSRHDEITEVHIKTDNASCMVSQDNIPYIWNLNKQFDEKYDTDFKVKGWITGEACTNKGRVDGHFAYTNIVINSYVEDGNDVTTEEQLFEGYKFRGGMKGSTAILIDAKGLDGQTVNSEKFKCKTGVRSTHYVKWNDDGVEVCRQSGITEPEKIPAATLNNTDSNHLRAEIKKDKDGAEFKCTSAKPPSFVTDANQPDANNAAAPAAAGQANSDSDSDIDPNDIVPATSKARKIKEALEQAVQNNPAPNSRPAAEVRDLEEGETSLRDILPAGWAYKSFKRKAATISSASLEMLRELEQRGKKNKKMKTPFHKAHEEVIMNGSSDWVETLTNDPMKVKGYMNMTDSKLKALIAKIKQKERELEAGNNDVADVDDGIDEEAMEAIENERLQAEAEAEAEELIVPDEAFGDVAECV